MLKLRNAFAFTLLLARSGRLEAQSPPLELTIEPPSGPPRTTFTLILANTGQTPFVFDDCCAIPRITSLDGQKVSCPPCPLRPCVPAGGILPPGGFLRVDWQPDQDSCAGEQIRAGIYDVHWDEFPDAVAARLEILPQGASALGAVPGTVRFGEPVGITLKNTTLLILLYNICCFPPSIKDPWGLEALCSPCVECIRPTALLSSEVLNFDWTPGRNACNKIEYPGRYRLLWGGFFELILGIGKEFLGTSSVLVLPREDRRLEMELSAGDLHPGETLKVTARNPLKVPIYRYRPGGCNDLILLDALGREAHCETACPPYQPVTGDWVQVIQPGEQIFTEVRIPRPEACGQAHGRWSVIWGRYFGLTQAPDPQSQVFGYEEINVLPPVFVRGDCDRQGSTNLTDVKFFLNYLFMDGEPPACLDACDLDDSGELDLTDALANLIFLYLGDPPPAAPFPLAGPDPTGDALGCEG